MKNKIFLCVCISMLLFSCKKKEETVVTNDEVEVIEQDLIVSNIGVQLSKDAAKELESWGEYQMVQPILDSYTSITKGRALENAKNLSDLVEGMKDSEYPEIIKRDDVIIRISVLLNHALRLHDMRTISSISDEEVETEIGKLLAAYSSLNDKINAVFQIEQYERKYQ